VLSWNFEKQYGVINLKINNKKQEKIEGIDDNGTSHSHSHTNTHSHP